jgi:hypothetical protein
LKPICPPTAGPLGSSQVGDRLSMMPAASVPQPNALAVEEMLS